MSGRESFDDALSRAIDALRGGTPIDAVLARMPEHARELRPLLETARRAGVGRPSLPPEPTGLAGNYSIVRAALERARAADAEASRPSGRTPWWGRRLTFASLSLPAGAVAFFLIAGASGAAAATVAVTSTDLPATIARVADAVTPDWAEGVVGGLTDDEKPAAPAGQPSPAHGAGGAGTAEANDTPGSDNAPVAATISGTISDVHGNTFTLTSADGAWKVNIDGKTVVTGEITEGATATVTGEVTAQKNLHASAVDVTALPLTPAEDGKTPGPPEDRDTGPPEDKTTGPPPGVTPGPPADQTPPGQGDGAGGGNGNGNGGGNGNGNGGANGNGNAGGGNGNAGGNGNGNGGGNGNANAGGNGNGNGGGNGNANAGGNGNGNGGGNGNGNAGDELP